MIAISSGNNSIYYIATCKHTTRVCLSTHSYNMCMGTLILLLVYAHVYTGACACMYVHVYTYTYTYARAYASVNS